MTKKTKLVKLDTLKLNPDNPRKIKPESLERLKKSLQSIPEMLKYRPIVHKNGIILGGNQRFLALKELGFEEVPHEWIADAADMDDEALKEFVIQDNLQRGDWDWDILAVTYDFEILQDWGLIKNDTDPDQMEKPAPWVPDCLFPSDNIYDIPTLDIELQADLVLNPFAPFGAEKRTRKGVGTYHFYVDDYRFQKIWDKPEQIAASGCQAIVEPNLSLFDTTPVSYGLHLIYKKRWIAKYLQQIAGIKVFVDLNVSGKFQEYNVMGVPKGWNAFATRGYSNRLPMLEEEIDIARKVSCKKNPFMVVYGGGQTVKEVVAEHNLIYVEQLRGFGKNSKDG